MNKKRRTNMINVEKILKAISTYKIYEFSEYNPLENEYTDSLKLFEEILMSFLEIDETFDDEVQTKMAIKYLKISMYSGVEEVEKAAYLILNEAYDNLSMSSIFNKAEYELYTKECETIEAVLNLTKTKIKRRIFTSAVLEYRCENASNTKISAECDTILHMLQNDKYINITLYMHMLKFAETMCSRKIYYDIVEKYIDKGGDFQW